MGTTLIICPREALGANDLTGPSGPGSWVSGDQWLRAHPPVPFQERGLLMGWSFCGHVRAPGWAGGLGDQTDPSSWGCLATTKPTRTGICSLGLQLTGPTPSAQHPLFLPSPWRPAPLGCSQIVPGRSQWEREWAGPDGRRGQVADRAERRVSGLQSWGAGSGTRRGTAAGLHLLGSEAPRPGFSCHSCPSTNTKAGP